MNYRIAILSKPDGPYRKGRTITTAPPRAQIGKGEPLVSADPDSPRGPIHVDEQRFAAWLDAGWFDSGSVRDVADPSTTAAPAIDPAETPILTDTPANAPAVQETSANV